MWALDIGGAERAVYQLVREQRRAGLKADVAAGSHRGFYGRKAEEAGATVHELGQRSALDPTIARRALALFRRYNIIHFHSAEPALVALACLTPARKYYTHRSGRFAYGRKQALRYGSPESHCAVGSQDSPGTAIMPCSPPAGCSASLRIVSS